jgi:universal stress protein E
MNKLAVIVVAVDSATSLSPAVHRAVALAKASGATLHFCGFVHDSAIDAAIGHVHPDVTRRARHDFIQEHQRAVARLAADHAGAGFPVECDVLWAPRADEAMIAKVLDVGADLFVKDARHESFLMRALFTPLDWKLMRLLPCNLMLVGPGSEQKLTRVAAAVDVLAEPTDADGLNASVVDQAQRVAEYLRADLNVVSVFPYLPVTQPGLDALGAVDVYELTNTVHLQAYNRFMTSHRVPVDSRTRLIGWPGATLADYVKDNGVGLLVLGSTYHNAWDRLLLGSTSEWLVQHVDSDVLLVKPSTIAAQIGQVLDLPALRKRHTALQADLPVLEQEGMAA